MEVLYYPTGDEHWDFEISKIIAYCDGRGLDIGAGGRTPVKDELRVDIDKKKEPDILADGIKLPVKDNEFDYITAVHAFEHFEDQDAVLKEWLRVIKPKGHILIIHPDVEFTHIQKPPEENPSLKADPYNKHFHERTLDQFVKWINPRKRYGFSIVSYGVALGNWSFYFILKKNEAIT